MCSWKPFWWCDSANLLHPAGHLMLPSPGMLLCGIRVHQEQDCNTWPSSNRSATPLGRIFSILNMTLLTLGIVFSARQTYEEKRWFLKHPYLAIYHHLAHEEINGEKHIIYLTEALEALETHPAFPLWPEWCKISSFNNKWYNF